MAKKRVIILGAGLAGLSTAWHLQRKGIDCCIFEKESDVGGLCRSKKISGFTFDYDGHLLHFKNPYTLGLIRSLLRNNLDEHQRSAWVYSFDRFSHYPFQANLNGLPHPVIKDCLLGFLESNKNGHLAKHAKLNFLDWINQTFGSGIARHFMVPYNTKFWTLGPQDLTCEWLDGLVPVPSLTQLIEGAVQKSQRRLGYNARFWYPREGGINVVPLAFASKIKNIHTNCRVSKIDLKNKEIELNSGSKENFDMLISTVPLPEISHLIDRLPGQVRTCFKKLRWNSIFNLNLGIDKTDQLRRHWIYFPEKEFVFFRVGFPHNFASSLIPRNKGSLYAEVSYSKEKPLDKNNILLRIKKDLQKAGLLNQNTKIYAQDVNDIEYGYPIYDNNYSFARERIIKFLGQNNIFPCGRYGSWRYMSMEDVIMDGANLAKKIIKIV